MLQRVDPNGLQGVSPNDRGAQHGVNFVEIFSFLKKSRWVILGWTAVASVLAVVFALTTAPKYTATATLILDTRKAQGFKNDSAVGDGTLDSARVESEVELLRSGKLAQAVISDLKLTNDPEFVNPSPGLVMTLVHAVFGANDVAIAKSEPENQRNALRILRENLAIRRLGLTYVLEVSYRSLDREKAARIANAVAEAYMVDQLDTKYQTTKRASMWLQQRISELRDQANSAARAVQDYKTQNGIINLDTGANKGGSGLLSDLQLQQLNAQMITATAATAEAKAKLDRVQEVLSSPAPNEALGTVADTLRNDVITGLRTRYLNARQREAELSKRYGMNHLSAINARNDMQELQRSIVDELRRIADSYRSDYEIAKTREQAMQTALQNLIKQSGLSGQAQVTLKELESSAETYRTIFESFLSKYTETVQQQSFPVSEAQIITAASPPVSKSEPKTTLITALGLFAGLGLGLAHAVMRRNFDRVLRTPREVAARIGLDCIGLVPTVDPDVPAVTASEARPVRAVGSKGQKPEKNTSSRPILAAPGITREVVRAPLSRFTESLRTVKTSFDITGLTRSVRSIGVISAIPNEGKSTIAVNLAHVFAASGGSTLLIDGDMRNPSLSRVLAPKAKRGLLELIGGTVSLEQALLADDKTHLCFLPVVAHHQIANSGDLLASDEMRRILADAAQTFERTVIDLPPLGAVVDARAMSPQIDAFVVVVEWGQTRYDVVSEALANFGAAADKVVGVVLNKVNYRELHSLDAYSRGYYYNKSYTQYGYSD